MNELVNMFWNVHVLLLHSLDVSPRMCSVFCRSVTHQVVSNSLQPHGLQHARLPCPSLSPGVCSNPCPLSRWCHPAISSSVIPFFSRLQSFPASGSFQMSQLFTSGGRSIRASASVLPMIIRGWFSLVLTSFISLMSKGLSRVFSNTAVQKHQFFVIVAFNQFKYHYHYDRLTVRFFLLSWFSVYKTWGV